MGQTHTKGSPFQDARIKDHFVVVKTLWNEDDLAVLIRRLKEMTLNFSLDKVKFAKMLQLASEFDSTVEQWFADFSQDRASQLVDGLEFISAAIMVSSKVPLFRKIRLLFQLFDLDKTSCIRKDEFTIFLKAMSTGLHRAVSGLPPPASVAELGAASTEYFATLGDRPCLENDMLMWMTEAHYSLHYLSVLSGLGSCVFAWGSNGRQQLGLHLEPRAQRVPTPLLSLEGVKVASVASGESHTLFLTAEGRVWSCGVGFCGILGHGSTDNIPQPKLIEALSHAQITHIAVGIRHSAVVSDKGQVFTWGAADMGQLGHGRTDDREVHEIGYDPKSGSDFVYVSRPTVVMGLFGQRVLARRASCCNFTTIVLSEQGALYSWGNNTDGQCGQGQRCLAHKLIYVDPHMQRTAMQVVMEPRRLPTTQTFKHICCGGYHSLAIDTSDRVWTWGQGMWGKLGHGDQRTIFDPQMVDALKYHVCRSLAAGEAHSLCLLSLYRLTITGSSESTQLSPFSLLGLPAGRVDRQAAARTATTPPNSSLQLNAFACAQLLQIGLPFHHGPGSGPMSVTVLPGTRSEKDIPESVVLMDHGLWEGDWLKLDTSDFDFRVRLARSSSPVSTQGVLGPIMLGLDGKWEEEDCEGKVCVFEPPPDVAQQDPPPTPEELVPTVLDFVARCKNGGGALCIMILPKSVDLFQMEAEVALPFGVMSYEHGKGLKAHVTRRINARIADSPGNLPEDVRDWRERQADSADGRTYYEHPSSGRRRWAPPQISPHTVASLVRVEKNDFLERLHTVLALSPKGIIVCQQSWRPDVTLASLPQPLLEQLHIPIVMVTWEAGEELKGVAADGSEPFVTMEMQPYGGVCAWGNGTFGQLGLAGIENQSFLTLSHNSLTNEDNAYATSPHYVSHLHEHQVVDIACGAAHTVAVTQQGEVFTWGVAEGAAAPAAPADGRLSEVPMFVEQLEGLVKSKKAFAGHYHSFVLADMPFKSIV